MKFETRIKKSLNGLYYPQYRKTYCGGWLKTYWNDLYGSERLDITRCWSSLWQAKEVCDNLHLTGKLVCTKDIVIYP